MSFSKCLVTGLAGVVFVAGPARGASAAQQVTKVAAVMIDDKTLESRIDGILKNDASLKAHEIDVNVDHGVVTLQGTVRTVYSKVHAGRLANIAGVTRVRNDIVVDANRAPTSMASMHLCLLHGIPTNSPRHHPEHSSLRAEARGATAYFNPPPRGTGAHEGQNLTATRAMRRYLRSRYSGSASAFRWADRNVHFQPIP